MSRNYRFDNIKFILITLVVFGHFLELIDGQATNNLYRIIYLFHIPAFIFITGYFAKFNPSKILFSFIMPYIILQILYLVFHAFIIMEKSFVTLQFTKPYWLLWYLMTITFYYLLIPFFEAKNRRIQVFIIGATLLASLLAGFDKNIGYFLSLSRFFTFLPYFLAGYYLAKNNALDNLILKIKSTFVIPLITVIGVILSLFFTLKVPFQHQVLYGSYSYESMAYDPATKLTISVFAFCWILLFFQIISDKKIPTISIIGKNTFPIFVLHGFLVKLADKHNLFNFSETTNLLLALTLTGGILILLGNKYTARLFWLLFDWNKKKNNV